MGENEEEFTSVLNELLEDNLNKDQIIKNLKELWIECNALHKNAVFIRQSFADSISRADILDPTNKESKLARNILMIDIE